MSDKKIDPATLSPEQRQQLVAHHEALMQQVMTSPDLGVRVKAARELGFLSPEGIEPPQTRVVLRMMRQSDGTFWPALEGSSGPVVQYIFADATQCVTVLGAVAQLAVNPLLTDEEFQAQTRMLDQIQSKLGAKPEGA